MRNNIQKFADVDKKDLSVTVPAGSYGLLSPIKKYFSDNSWKMKVYKGANISEGVIGRDKIVQSYGTYNTRYNLLVESQQFDWCLPEGDKAYFYNLSLIDNDSGSEILTMDGRSCENTIMEKFKASIESK